MSNIGHDLAYARVAHRWPRVVLSCLASAALALYTATALVAAPIDEFRISELEQRIRDLETATREQARVLNQLLDQSSTKPLANLPATSAMRSEEQRWLSANQWQRVQPGMSELQVIELLGPPTQTRVSDDGRTRSLLYALEIGRSGFLTGKIDLQEHRATHIEIPQLK